MIIYNSVMTLVIAVLSFIDYKEASVSIQGQIYNNSVLSLIILLNTLILAYSVLVIRKTIQSLQNAFPNEKLIRIHLINSCICSFTFLLSTTVSILVEMEG